MKIEENRDLYRSFEIYKAFAVYNMVILHGLAMLIGLFSAEAYHELGHHGLRFIRSAFSMTLPIYAGFYLRHFIGPFLSQHRLQISIGHLSVRIVYLAFLIEAVRQFLMRWHLRHSFSWHSLHFCALAFFVSVVLAKRDTRLLGGVTILLLLIRAFLPDPSFTVLDLSHTGYEVTALLWGLSFGLLAWGWALPRKRMPLSMKLVPILLLSLLGYFIIAGDRQELLSFFRLPYSAFFLVKGDSNYWPLLIFYPFFTAGYFFRSILFDIQKKFLFLPLLFIACIGVALSYSQLPELSQVMARGSTIQREAFSMPSVHVFGIMSFFFVGWSVTYLIFRKDRFPWIDNWVRWTGSVILVYVVHTAIYALTVRLLMTIDYPRSSILFLYSILHIGYFISLGICYHLQKTIPKITGFLR